MPCGELQGLADMRENDKTAPKTGTEVVAQFRMFTLEYFEQHPGTWISCRNLAARFLASMNGCKIYSIRKEELLEGLQIGRRGLYWELWRMEEEHILAVVDIRRHGRVYALAHPLPKPQETS